MAKKDAKKKAEKPVLPRSYVTLLLDRSGSMETIKSQTIEGYNTFLTGLQTATDADIRFTFLQFDSNSLDKIYVAAPIGEVALLTNRTFIPRGGTPLIDASYQTIKAVEEAIAGESPAPKVIIAIQTDGEENSSRSHTWEELSALVKAKQECGWMFNFLGAGIDAYQQAAKMSIAVQDTMSYGTGMAETQAAFAGTSSNNINAIRGMSSNTSYSVGQKAASGDVFDPEGLKLQGLLNVSQGKGK